VTFSTYLVARASLDILIPDLKNLTEEEPKKADSDLNDLSVNMIINYS